MPDTDPTIHRYLPKRNRACPQCRKTAHVQIIVYGMPAVPPTPEEEDRVAFAGCVMIESEDPSEGHPKWRCPACQVSYTGRGEVVPKSD